MRRLKESIETGETLRIIYHGGSQPGTVREIVPQSIKGEKLRAFCIGSGASKTFIISKIEINIGAMIKVLLVEEKKFFSLNARNASPKRIKIGSLKKNRIGK